MLYFKIHFTENGLDKVDYIDESKLEEMEQEETITINHIFMIPEDKYNSMNHGVIKKGKKEKVKDLNVTENIVTIHKEDKKKEENNEVT